MPPDRPPADPGDVYMRSAAHICDVIERELGKYPSDREKDLIMAWVREGARVTAERRARALAEELHALKLRLTP